MTRTARTPFEIVLCDRQIALIAVLMAALIMVIGGIAYLAGRMVAPAQVHGANTDSNRPSVIIVDPLPLEAPSTAAVKPISRLLSSGTGRSFLQVAVVEPGMAEVTADYLVRRGFEAYYAPGARPEEYRVLVAGGADVSKTQAALEAAGFRSFVRRY